jgi:hypothetical protein
MIVFGTGSYTLQRFAASDFGLFNNGFSDVELVVLKRYAHLYWIPVFPLETLYAAKKQGSSDKYEISDESLKQLLQAQPISFWKHLLAFAGPLLLILGFTYYNMQDSFRHAASEKAQKAGIVERAKALSDTTALRPFANQFISIVNCLEKSEMEKPLHIEKIDTSTDKILRLVIKCLSTSRDTTIPYGKENVLISRPNLDFMSSYEQPVSKEESLFDYYYLNCFQSYNLTDSGVLKWYQSNFKNSPPIDEGYTGTSIKAINERLAQFKYIVNTHITGYAEPSIDPSKERFNSGYISAKVVVYEVGTHKLIEKYDIIATNSESISFMRRQNESVSSPDMKSRLQSDLSMKINQAVRVSLRIETEKQISLPF